MPAIDPPRHKDRTENTSSMFCEIASIHDCIREKMELEVKCQACGHTTTIDPLELHRQTMTKRVWSDLKDIERAMRCDKCKAKQCKPVPVERF